MDVWLLHSEGDRRQVPTILSFAHYALSPSTVRVVFSLDREKPASGEIRAYGPEPRQFVWYKVHPWTSRYVGSIITGLFKEMDKLNKLVVI